MSSRDRWTIYPLLFFSIGLALFTRITFSEQVDSNVVNCDVLNCRRVRVLGASGQEQASLSERGLVAHSVNVTIPSGESRLVLDTGATNSGQFQLLGSDGNRRVAFGSAEKSHAGEMAIFGESPDLPLVLISAEGDGGTISTQTAAGKRLMFLTHANGGGTMVSFDAAGKPRFYLTASLRPQANGEAGQPETKAAPAADENPPATEEPPTEEPQAESPADTDTP